MRLVVKIGSSSLIDERGRRRIGLMGALAEDIAAARADHGCDVVVVSSGAVATGLGVMGLTSRPRELPALQAASALGQGALFATWSDMFALRDVRAAQVLLTLRDAWHRPTWINAKSTIEQLLAWQVVPIINENDTTATDEITFGDNDLLAAQLAVSLGANHLVLLTDIDGIYTEHPDSPTAERIEQVEDHTLLQRIDTASRGSHWGSGGVRSKVVAAEMAATGGATTTIAAAARTGVVTSIVAGERLGTTVVARERRGSSFKLWLRYAKGTEGVLTVDAGAERALREAGASLLGVGITDIEGTFAPGAAVAVQGASGAVIAKGLVDAGASDLRRGHASSVVIHRDRLVVYSA